MKAIRHVLAARYSSLCLADDFLQEEIELLQHTLFDVRRQLWIRYKYIWKGNKQRKNVQQKSGENVTVHKVDHLMWTFSEFRLNWAWSLTRIEVKLFKCKNWERQQTTGHRTKEKAPQMDTAASLVIDYGQLCTVQFIGRRTQYQRQIKWPSASWECEIGEAGWQGSIRRHSVSDGWHTSLRSNGFKLSTNTIGYLNAVARQRRTPLRSCSFTFVQYVRNYSSITTIFSSVHPHSVHCKMNRLSLRSHSFPLVNAWLILCTEALQIVEHGHCTIPLLLLHVLL